MKRTTVIASGAKSSMPCPNPGHSGLPRRGAPRNDERGGRCPLPPFADDCKWNCHAREAIPKSFRFQLFHFQIVRAAKSSHERGL
jgi:hypothetical protein